MPGKNKGIKIPKKFDKILTGPFRAFVDSTITRYNDIFINNKLEFFQEYTDHGINHVEELLEAAENIIDKDSFKFLNEKDISVLIISILLHDIGMHISKEGLIKIMHDESDKWRVTFFDKRNWKDEWINYFQEAKRFNDEQLKNIFGNTEQNITEPNLELLDNYTRKIYGEFLRRHHHRLAHEIALGGFPTQLGAENVNIYSEDIEKDIIDLAGLVARSHGMPVRKAIDYLEKKFQDAWRAPYNVKSVFLMIVLRIADYLQIHSERASKIILRSKRFASPLSKKEWEKHNSIKDINIKTADPERIFVIAKPENSAIYLELEKLFEDIQSELDISWAILGEAYGKDSDLKNLKIQFRRIRSVLDDKEEFAKNIDYIPEKIFFNADPSLLKLLIGPLYGEDPKYGVRELLQNSIDAVKEREYLSKIQGSVNISLQPIKKGKPRYEFIISDSGIGMTKDTIINYFFKAGASFRKSMNWKKNFIEDNEVQIQKTGRFGVGVLAVFLLGDEFELWSKYDAPDSQGYYCKASLGMSQVELLKMDCNIGTTIRIILKESVNELINSTLTKIKEHQEHDLRYNTDRLFLEWFTWYLMDRPKIEYSIDNSLKNAFRFILPQMAISSNPDMPLSDWRIFNTKDYRSIHWTIDLKRPSIYHYYDSNHIGRIEHNDLICNGFKINKGYVIQDKSFNWGIPKISVFDNNAHFPLSLNRDYIQEGVLPFEEELIEFIVIEVINTILRTEFVQVGSHYLPEQNFLDLYGRVDLSEFLVVIGDEYTVLEPSIFSILKLQDFIQFWLKSGYNNDRYNFKPVGVYQASKIVSDPITFYKQILEPASYTYDRNLHWLNLKSHAIRNDSFSRVYIPTAKIDYLFQGKRLSQSYKSNINRRILNSKWNQIISDKTEKHKHDTNLASLSPDVYPLIIKRHTGGTFDESNFFIRTWIKYLGREWTFPIDKSKRPKLIKSRR
jgi:molecular chaperone HtpG